MRNVTIGFMAIAALSLSGCVRGDYTNQDCRVGNNRVEWNSLTIWPVIGEFYKGDKLVGTIAVPAGNEFKAFNYNDLVKIGGAYCTTGDFRKAQEVAAKIIFDVPRDIPKPIPRPQ